MVPEGPAGEVPQERAPAVSEGPAQARARMVAPGAARLESGGASGSGAAGTGGTGGTSGLCNSIGGGAQIVSGLFALTGRYAVENYPQVCDVDGDGNLDLVNVTSNELIVRRGRGDGTFEATPVLTSSANPTGQFLLADFNGDGRCDVYFPPNFASSSMSSPFTFAQGSANATFTVGTNTALSPFGGTTPTSLGQIGVANVVEGSPVDLVTLSVTAGVSGRTMGILECNEGLCTLNVNGPFLGTRGGLYGAALGDVNGDRHVDILASYYFQTLTGTPTPAVALLKGDGKGGFATGPAIPQLAGAYRIVDLDQDGFPDVAVLTGSQYSVFWGDATLSFSASSALYAASTYDFDNDGKLDIEINQTSGVNCITFGAGNRVWGQRMLLAPVGLGDFGDFNNDGVPDVSSYDTQSGLVSIYVSTAKQTPSGPPDIQCGSVPAAQCAGPTSF